MVAAPFRAPPSLMLSLSFLLRDVVYAAAVVAATLAVAPYVPTSVLWLVYSIVMGTVITGIWVLGHECGHGAFGATRLENDVVGFVLHSLLLVPYWSWQYSHNKHHKYTNHLTYEYHAPINNAHL